MTERPWYRLHWAAWVAAAAVLASVAYANLVHDLWEPPDTIDSRRHKNEMYVEWHGWPWLSVGRAQSRERYSADRGYHSESLRLLWSNQRTLADGAAAIAVVLG